MSDFLDEVEVTFVSGKGGNGAATFHREKHVPRGGPNGANGGKGGSVILVADRHKRTLIDFRYQKEFKAENGENAVANKTGKDGKDLRIPVPIGTVISDLDLDEVIADLSVEGVEFIICHGGRGGMGNLHYTNSVRQAPQFAQNGAPSEEVIARLELKLVADVGLIGLPNAGKSTLLSRISAAKPKIGNYPFTTITPNLGVVEVGDQSLTISDLPGLIEGASEGHGLGHQFLKHAERNLVLLHLVDMFPMDESDPRKNYDLIENELMLYNKELYEMPRIIALNKADISPDEELIDLVKEKFADLAHPLFVISGVSGRSLDELKFALLEKVNEQQSTENFTRITPVFEKKRDNTWSVEKEEGEYIVIGDRIDRLIAMTQLGNPEALHHLLRKLRRIGVIDKLESAGIEEGDTVVMGGMVFEYKDWS